MGSKCSRPWLWKWSKGTDFCGGSTTAGSVRIGNVAADFVFEERAGMEGVDDAEKIQARDIIRLEVEGKQILGDVMAHGGPGLNEPGENGCFGVVADDLRTHRRLVLLSAICRPRAESGDI